MDLEIINKLFLELLKVATATTAREVRLKEMLQEANEVLRSAASIAERKGESTNWDSFRVRLTKVLTEQHRLLHPEMYAVESA